MSATSVDARAGVPPQLLGAAVPAGPVRVAAFVILGAFGMAHWAAQVEPAATAEGWACVLLGAAVGGGWVAMRRTGTARLGWLLAAAAVPLILLLSGAPARLLLPDRWPELATGIGQGLAALPNTTVPYRGVDEWVRTVILAGGGLLLLLAAVLAFNPLRGGRADQPAAGVGLIVLWAVPVVERNPLHPFVDGAVLAVLVAGFLWADRLEASTTRIAIGVLAAALAAALLAAPTLDVRNAWIDYEALANRLSPRAPSTFDWSHSYGPLHWPRGSSEVLRVKARQPAYWKATTLDDFDGVRWMDHGLTNTAQDSEFARVPGWQQQLRVVVKKLTSRQFVAAGDVLRIRAWDKPVVPTAGGTRVSAARPLRPGDSYVADVYVPKPDRVQMATAGTAYPDFTEPDRQVRLPLGPVRRDPRTGQGVVGDSAVFLFPAFGDDPRNVQVAGPTGFIFRSSPEVVRRSAYGRVYALARRLRQRSSSPYDYARRVRERVQLNATYDERPLQHLLPLDAFLFEDPDGYCQQFSGAMALLLRMGGVPARIASGFSPGEYDRDRREWVVRDTDAHSWVEAYFPRIGWVTFDPTPAEAPPASQATDDAGAAGGAGSTGRGRDTASDRGSEPPTAATPSGGGTVTARSWSLRIGLAALAALIVAAWALARRAERRARALAGHEPRALWELRRALARTGRRSEATTTLWQLERRLAADPAAAGYVRALRLGRYGATGDPPTAAGRRALRAALAAGLGLSGRIRSWWALPPRLSLAGLGDVRKRLGGRRDPAYTGR